MAIDTIFKQLPEAANACPDLVRVGRCRDVEFLSRCGLGTLQSVPASWLGASAQPLVSGLIAAAEARTNIAGRHYGTTIRADPRDSRETCISIERTSEYRRAGLQDRCHHLPRLSDDGEYDYSCTPELTRETAARIPGAEAIIMDGIGHFPMSENPDRFAAFVLRCWIAF